MREYVDLTVDTFLNGDEIFLKGHSLSVKEEGGALCEVWWFALSKIISMRGSCYNFTHET